MNKIIKKWLEPYVLLEELKKHADMTDYTFDGFSKNEIKKLFLKELQNKNKFGLYMKNVNKFYLFNNKVDILELFEINEKDYISSENTDEAFNAIDLGKAESAFFNI